MNVSLRVVLLSAALALSGCASAAMGEQHRHGMNDGAMAAREAGDHGMQCPMMGMMTPLVGCHGARGDAEARLASLRATLRITSSQEGVWNAYADAYRANAAHMGAGMMRMEAGGEASPPPSVVDRLRHHEMMMSRHMASLQALRATIEPLYASFSAEQKTAADALRCERPS
ncbi:MAG: hypothetical protein FD124_487 [Alphaproteobacteria bacterium]|nr:MAG: hypothetical protein FD160_621 [Caulobacteraceae bacterium]TPW08348.1 MAG: hypothetical protein FD124_487 [Alphaproteobacteria bacterium]